MADKSREQNVKSGKPKPHDGAGEEDHGVVVAGAEADGKTHQRGPRAEEVEGEDPDHGVVTAGPEADGKTHGEGAERKREERPGGPKR